MPAKNEQKYAMYRYCARCCRWVPRAIGRCPGCKNDNLRSVPRGKSKKRRNLRRQHTLEDARRIFERFLSRGYSVEEAREATLAITGIEVRLAEVEADGGER